MKITLLIFVLFGVLSSFAMEQNTRKAQWIGVHPKSEVMVEVAPRPIAVNVPEIVISKALYGVVDDPSKQIDVTANVQKLVDGLLSKAYDPRKIRFKVDSKLAGRVPASDTKNVLQLDYRVNQMQKKMTAKEGEVAALLPVPKKTRPPLDVNAN